MAFQMPYWARDFGAGFGDAFGWPNVWDYVSLVGGEMRKAGGLRSALRMYWNNYAGHRFQMAGAITGTLATAGLLGAGAWMAAGGAYDLVTARRRSRLAGFTSLAVGGAIAGLPFYGRSLYGRMRPYIGRIGSWLRG